MQRVAVAMPAGEHAFAPEADALERELRAPVAGVRPCRQAVQPQVLERERGDQRLGLEVRAAPPPVAPEPRPDGGVAVARRELGEARDADRPLVTMDDEEQIGRASCRGKGEISGGGGSFKKKKEKEKEEEHER